MQPSILIVDDQEDIVEDIEQNLQASMYERIRVSSCSNIQDAENNIGENAPDIIVLDINLPLKNGEDPEDGSGMELVSYIRSIQKRIIIILITGETRLETQDDYLNRGLNAGIDEIILKESSVNFVREVAERVEYLSGLLIKLYTNIGKEIGNDVIVYDLPDQVLFNLKQHFPEIDFIPVNSVQAATELCDNTFVCICIALVDTNEGTQFIRRFFGLRQEIPVVAISTLNNIGGFKVLKNALRDGAHFAARFDEENTNVNRVIITALDQRKSNLNRYKNIIGTHPSLLKTLGQADVAAANNEPVLIVGDSGTGKELIAIGINDFSGRDGNYIDINCAALPKDLLESELFGHEKGAFTGASNFKVGLFEQADNGTLFLDEITELPLDLQAKLLKVIENREMRRVGGNKSIQLNVKVIAATNQNIVRLVEQGKFRNDLYQRIKAFAIYIPSLQSRVSDIPKIVYFYIEHISNREAKSVIGIEDDAMDALCTHNWSNGNVRGLKNTLEKIVAFLPKGRELIFLDDVVEALKEDASGSGLAEVKMMGFLSLKEVEHWAGFNHCIAFLKSILKKNNAVKVGEAERAQLKQELGINSDATFYSCIDNGIKIAKKIVLQQQSDVDLQGILNVIGLSGHQGLENFISDRVKRCLETAQAEL